MILRSLRWIWGAATVLVAALVLLGLLAPWSEVADAFGQFRHVLVPLLAAMAVVMLLWKGWRIGGAGLLVAIGAVIATPEIWEGGSAAPAGTEITLVQANLYFRNSRVEGLADLAANADIVTLQELSSSNEAILAALADRFPGASVCKFARIGSTAVLSRYPVLDKGCADGLSWLRVEIGGQPVTLVSLHLHWPWPFGQQEHLDKLRPVLEALPRPVVVAGDFNAAPWGRGVARVGAWSGTSVAPGFRITITKDLPVLGIPVGLPIDHVMLPDGASLVELATGAPYGSDHRPVVARFTLPGPEAAPE